VERGGLPNVNVGDVGVSGGEEGSAGWGNAMLGVTGRIFAKYPRLSQTTIVNGRWVKGGRLLQRHQGVNALSRYLQRGEERRGEMQFMISNSVENPTLVRAVRGLGGFVDISFRGDKGSGLRYRKGSG
jgi:hypothetical protein